VRIRLESGHLREARYPGNLGIPRRHGAAGGDAWPEVPRISGLVSFEPDKIAVYLDGARLRLEPGQNVIPHGVD
jgi:hypothetical protein